MEKSIFKEYDIRGIYNQELTDNDAYLIGQGYGSYIIDKFKAHTCIVGQDNRLSSPSLAKHLIKGILSTGCNVIDLGVCTTPMLSYATIKLNNIYAIMTTASHNPKDYNGFKFTLDNLGFARGKQIFEFRDYVLKENFKIGQGTLTSFNIYPYYEAIIKDRINMQNKKLKVVIDPGNGTTSLFAKNICSMFDNLEIIMINDVSDATFPNHHPDPNVEENLKQLQMAVLENKADVGLAYDGDGDRIGAVDEKGNIVSTEYLMILAIRELIDKNNNQFLFDVKCSKVLEDEIIKLGGKPICIQTGASYTRAKTNELKLIFGGEYSGHLFYRDKWFGFDSGIYNGLRILETLSKSKKTFSQQFLDVAKYVNTPEIKIKVKSEDDKKRIVEAMKSEIKKLNLPMSLIDGIKVDYKNGWVLLRASNTTMNLTMRIEADTKENLNAIHNHFMSILYKYIN